MRPLTFFVHPAERPPPVTVFLEEVRIDELSATNLSVDLVASIVGPWLPLQQREVAEVVVGGYVMPPGRRTSVQILGENR